MIALTRPAAGRLLRDGIPEPRIRVIPPGYDPDLFATAVAAPDPFPDLGRPRVGYVGRIAPQKDVGTLIRAFGLLTGPACLLIVGDGPGLQAAEQQARSLAWPVRFTGFAPHAQIPVVLRHIDLLVLATRYEELPSVLIAAGHPLRPANPDVGQAQAEHVVPPDRPAALLGDEIPQVGSGVPERRVLRELGLAHRHQVSGHPGPVDVARGQPPGLQERRRQQHPVEPAPCRGPPHRVQRPDLGHHVPAQGRIAPANKLHPARRRQPARTASSPRATRLFSATASASSSDRVLVSTKHVPAAPSNAAS